MRKGIRTIERQKRMKKREGHKYAVKREGEGARGGTKEGNEIQSPIMEARGESELM